MKKITVIGGGLAGTEAALQIAKRGIEVDLYEMRPEKKTGAHSTDYLAELVCSNSLGSNDLSSASGLLKQELRTLGSYLIKFADETSIPAGTALAVDREGFARKVSLAVKENPLINLINEEICRIPETTPVIIASGPLTSQALSEDIKKFTGKDHLYFFDAIAPIIERDSVNFDKAFMGSRYNKGEASYINCPMNKDEYEIFHEKLINSPLIELKEFEKNSKFFESCLPLEILAKRGKDALRYACLKPVGLIDPRTNVKNYAVVQLRQDNKAASLYNLVGFQTNLKWSAQKELIKCIPGLENAEILRYGVMHRNTFIHSPSVLKPTLQAKVREDLFFAGQISGVEGYTESVATGLLAGINASLFLKSQEMLILEPISVLGALCSYITHPEHKNFQPINSNFGILKPLNTAMKGRKNKQHKKRLFVERALSYLTQITNCIF